MTMVTLVAEPIGGFTVRLTDDVNFPGRGELTQLVVHGGETNRLAVLTQLRVEDLGAAEAGVIGEDRFQRALLPGGALTAGRGLALRGNRHGLPLVLFLPGDGGTTSPSHHRLRAN
jgi:hypothetical protein